MDTTQSQILSRVRHQGGGAVVTPKDFLDLASRDAVDQALTRLVRAGKLARIGRGLYHLPQVNPTLGIAVPPDPDKVADAIGRQTGSRVAPSPAVLANRIGVSTQIPAKPVYQTTGRSRSVKVMNQTFQLKHAATDRLPDPDSPVDQALQAIRFLGPDPDDAVIARLRRVLSPKDRKKLVSVARYGPTWVAEVARRVGGQAADTEGAVAHG